MGMIARWVPSVWARWPSCRAAAPVARGLDLDDAPPMMRTLPHERCACAVHSRRGGPATGEWLICTEVSSWSNRSAVFLPSITAYVCECVRYVRYVRCNEFMVVGEVGPHTVYST